jgi:hypothetical protein
VIVKSGGTFEFDGTNPVSGVQPNLGATLELANSASAGGVARGTIVAGGIEIVSAHGTDFAAQLTVGGFGGVQYVFGLASGTHSR